MAQSGGSAPAPQPQATYRAAQEVERSLKTLHKDKNFYDPEVRGLRAQLAGLYEDLLLNHWSFAQVKEVEQALWKSVYYKPIEEFRRRIRLAADAGERGREPLRKVKTAFGKFLDEASAFYRRLALALQAAHGDVGFTGVPGESPEPGAAAAATAERRSAGSGIVDIRISVYRCLICLGDIARYQANVVTDLPKKDWSMAEKCYRQAIDVFPEGGNAFNQLAVLATYLDSPLDAVYHYFRSLAVAVPFLIARENLVLLFDQNRLHFERLTEPPPAVGGRGGRGGRGRGEERGGRGGGARRGPVGRRGGSVGAQLQDLYTRFIRLHGILFTKINVDTFSRVYSWAMAELDETLSRQPALKAATASPPSAHAPLLQLAAMALFTVHNVDYLPPGAKSGYSQQLQRAELKRHALTLVLGMAAWLMRCAAGAAVADAADARLRVLPSLSALLQWLAGHPEHLEPSPSDDADQAAARQALCAAGAPLAGWLAAEAATRQLPVAAALEPAQLALREDWQLRGFQPMAEAVTAAQVQLQFQKGIDEQAEHAVRIIRLLCSLRKITTVLEATPQPPIGAAPFIAAVQVAFGERAPPPTPLAQQGPHPAGDEHDAAVALAVAAKAAAAAQRALAGLPVPGAQDTPMEPVGNGADEEEVIVYHPGKRGASQSPPALGTPPEHATDMGPAQTPVQQPTGTRSPCASMPVSPVLPLNGAEIDMNVNQGVDDATALADDNNAAAVVKAMMANVMSGAISMDLSLLDARDEQPPDPLQHFTATAHPPAAFAAAAHHPAFPAGPTPAAEQPISAIAASTAATAAGHTQQQQQQQQQQQPLQGDGEAAAPAEGAAALTGGLFGRDIFSEERGEGAVSTRSSSPASAAGYAGGSLFSTPHPTPAPTPPLQHPLSQPAIPNAASPSTIAHTGVIGAQTPVPGAVRPPPRKYRPPGPSSLRATAAAASAHAATAVSLDRQQHAPAVSQAASASQPGSLSGASNPVPIAAPPAPSPPQHSGSAEQLLGSSLAAAMGLTAGLVGAPASLQTLNPTADGDGTPGLRSVSVPAAYHQPAAAVSTGFSEPDFSHQQQQELRAASVGAFPGHADCTAFGAAHMQQSADDTPFGVALGGFNLQGGQVGGWGDPSLQQPNAFAAAPAGFPAGNHVAAQQQQQLQQLGDLAASFSGQPPHHQAELYGSSAMATGMGGGSGHTAAPLEPALQYQQPQQQDLSLQPLANGWQNFGPFGHPMQQDSAVVGFGMALGPSNGSAQAQSLWGQPGAFGHPTQQLLSGHSSGIDQGGMSSLFSGSISAAPAQDLNINSAMGRQLGGLAFGGGWGGTGFGHAGGDAAVGSNLNVAPPAAAARPAIGDWSWLDAFESSQKALASGLPGTGGLLQPAAPAAETSNFQGTQYPTDNPFVP